MKRVLATAIIADQPTSNLNIYPKDILERAVKQFNARAAQKPIKGGILNPIAIDDIGEPTHITKKLFLNNSGVLCAEVEILDTEAGRQLGDNIKSEKVVARPVMCVPSYIDIIKDQPKSDPLKVDKINSIVRIQVEYEHQRDDQQDHESRTQ